MSNSLQPPQQVTNTSQLPSAVEPLDQLDIDAGTSEVPGSITPKQLAELVTSLDKRTIVWSGTSVVPCTLRYRRGTLYFN